MATTFTSVFHVYADNSSDADAVGQPSVFFGPVNDTSFTPVPIGNRAIASGKTSLFSRFDLDRPFSGPAMSTTGDSTVLKAKVTLTVHTTAVIDGVTGVGKVGILSPSGPFLYNNLAFGSIFYPTRPELPIPTGEDDVVIADRLYNDHFLNGPASDGYLYVPAAFFAGRDISFGEGYPDDAVYGDYFQDMVSELDTYLKREDYKNPPPDPIFLGVSPDRTLAFVMDTAFNPVGVDENYYVFTSDDPLESGMVLTIEWEVNQTEGEVLDVVYRDLPDTNQVSGVWNVSLTSTSTTVVVPGLESISGVALLTAGDVAVFAGDLINGENTVTLQNGNPGDIVTFATLHREGFIDSLSRSV